MFPFRLNREAFKPVRNMPGVLSCRQVKEEDKPICSAGELAKPVCSCWEQKVICREMSSTAMLGPRLFYLINKNKRKRSRPPAKESRRVSRLKMRKKYKRGWAYSSIILLYRAKAASARVAALKGARILPVPVPRVFKTPFSIRAATDGAA